MRGSGTGFPSVTLIQRFGSALNLNIHFHMLFLDGVYDERRDGSLRFRWVTAPTSAELARLTQTLALRIGRYLERQGLLERDAEYSYLAGDDLEAGPMEQLLDSSITYRIAVGSHHGRKVFTLQTLPACNESFDAGLGDDRISLAVLPFVDLSAAKDQEYFSDGLTEEILNQLAQIPTLRVSGRTSSFSFKGRNEDLRSIAQQLGVANLLEGSVRREGTRLRTYLTDQPFLFRTSNGYG